MNLNRLLRYLDLPNLIFPSSLHGNRAGSAALQRSQTHPGYRRGGGWTFPLLICPTLCACLCHPAVSLPVLHTPLCLLLPPLSLFLVQMSGIHSLFFLPVRQQWDGTETSRFLHLKVSSWLLVQPKVVACRTLAAGADILLAFKHILATWSMVFPLLILSCCLWQQTHQVV